MELTVFEREALAFILAREAPELLPTLDDLRVAQRTDTGMGVAIDFAPGPAVAGPPRKGRMGNLVLGLLDGSDDALRFALYADDGQLTDLEVSSTDGNALPDDLSAVRFERMTLAREEDAVGAR